MTKQDLIESLVDQGYCETKSKAKSTIDFIFMEITSALASGSGISLPGFGKFLTATQAARSGTMSGKAWKSKAKQVPKFKASSTLKDAVA